MRQLCQLYTGNQQCYSVRYSPFDSQLLACASCDNFGISGAASLYFLLYEENDVFASKFTINDSCKFDASIFDIDWSPLNKNLLVSANGDGSIAVWRFPIVRSNRGVLPYVKVIGHEKEVYGVQWEPSGSKQYSFLSASWDQTVKLWNINNDQVRNISTINGHQGIVYSAAWNPKNIGMLLSVSADKTFRLWDTNSNQPQSNSIASIYTSDHNSSDILCCDWCKHDSNIFALGYASGLIEIRDIRNLKTQPVKSFENAHDYAIRKIRFSPLVPYVFGSVSYDMVTKIWHPSNGLLDYAKNHTEFAYGFDFDSKKPNRIVDCGWDRRVAISEFKLQN